MYTIKIHVLYPMRNPQQLDFLEKAISKFETLERKCTKVNKSKKRTRPICFDGMCWTLNVINNYYVIMNKNTMGILIF